MLILFTTLCGSLGRFRFRSWCCRRKSTSCRTRTSFRSLQRPSHCHCHLWGVLVTSDVAMCRLISFRKLAMLPIRPELVEQ